MSQKKDAALQTEKSFVIRKRTDNAIKKEVFQTRVEYGHGKTTGLVYRIKRRVKPEDITDSEQAQQRPVRGSFLTHMLLDQKTLY